MSAQARSVLAKPSLLPLLGVVTFTLATAAALTTSRLTNNVDARSAFKSNGARADEVTVMKARAIKRRMDAKKQAEKAV